MQVPDQIQRIETKVHQLLKEYNFLQKETARLTKENIKLQEELAAKTELLNKLHQKTDAKKITKLVMQDSEKKELEKRIDFYLKDIDKCLSLLNS